MALPCSLRGPSAGKGKGKGKLFPGTFAWQESGEPAAVSPFVLFLFDAASFDATEEWQKHFTTPPLLSEKSPAWQPGAISIGNTNWGFPDRKHPKKGRYAQCRAYQ